MTTGSWPVIYAAWIKTGTPGACSYAMYKCEEGAS
jgi:hypothetical protein